MEESFWSLAVSVDFTEGMSVVGAPGAAAVMGDAAVLGADPCDSGTGASH
jgi:hypothetical protein